MTKEEQRIGRMITDQINSISNIVRMWPVQSHPVVSCNIRFDPPDPLFLLFLNASHHQMCRALQKSAPLELCMCSE